MDAKLAGKFIGMYVNDFTLDYGETGREAIRQFLSESYGLDSSRQPFEIEFVS